MAFYNGSGQGLIAGVADTGAATDYLDLLLKIKNAAVAEGWTVLKDLVNDEPPDRDLMLRGPGTTPGVQPYIGFRTYRDVPDDIYNFFHYCMTGFDNSLAVTQQPGINTIQVDFGTCHWLDPIPYYLMINDRRIHCVVNVDGVWQHFYQGFFLPYGTPAQYPFPQYLGAHTNDPNLRYSTTTGNFRSHLSDPAQVNGMYWDPYGAQRQINGSANGGRLHPAQSPSFNFEGEAPPYTTSPSSVSWTNQRPLRNTPDEFLLWPCIIYKPYRYQAGELDGCFKVAGFSNATGDLVTVNGKTYLMVQDGYRTGFADYFAVLLE